MTYDPRQPEGFQPYQNTDYGDQQSYGAPKTSVAAIIGFVGGVTSFIPCLGIVTGPVGFVSSIIGFFTTGKPTVKGRWMAVLGFLFSIVGFVVMNLLLLGGGGYWAFHKGYDPVANAATDFVTALANDDMDAARNVSSGLSDEQLAAFAEQLNTVGANPKVECTLQGFNVQVVNTGSTGMITGTATGNGNTVNFSVDVEGGSDLNNMMVTGANLN